MRRRDQVDMPRRAARLLGLVLLALGLCAPAWGQVPGASPATRPATQPATPSAAKPDPAAATLLASAHQAYVQKDPSQAAERYRQFLKTYPQHPDAACAQYGLGLCLLDVPEKDYAAAIAALEPAAAEAGFVHRAFALYYLGAAHRGAAQQLLAQAAAKPAEAAALRAAANQRCEQAVRQLAAAVSAFSARLAPGPDGPELPPAAEWVARARCEEAQLLLQLDRAKEAVELVDPLATVGAWRKSRQHALAVYLYGYACFKLHDSVAAGRALVQLAPFDQPFGVHARYLLARLHDLAGERPEAIAQYQAVLAGYDASKKAAQTAIQDANALRDNPAERARLQVLAQGPAPEYVIRAGFHLGRLFYEDGRCGEALERFTALAKDFPKSPLADEARLRQGMSLVQLQQWAEAQRVLQPLTSHALLGYQALWWLGKMQWGAALPSAANGQRLNEGLLKQAIDSLRRGAELAEKAAAGDELARSRRPEILLDLADAQMAARQFADAAAAYQQAADAPAAAEHREEARQRQVTALHLAGRFAESDAAAARFEQAYPHSTLLPLVWFRAAESAFQAAAKGDDKLPPAEREAQQKRLLAEAAMRYQRTIDKYPEFVHIDLARRGLALACYRAGAYGKALAAFDAIPASARTGELAAVPFLAADCLLRTLPPVGEDALSACRMLQQAERAAALLEPVVAGQPDSPASAAALYRLGLCHERMASVLGDPNERREELTKARQALERIGRWSQSPVLAPATFEKAQCQALQGDLGGAASELSRFQRDPLRQTPLAPLALARLAGLMRAQNRANEVVNLMQQVRPQLEPALAKDPARAPWAALLQLEHGMALRMMSKPAEARAIFEATAAQFPGRPEALEAGARAAQCRGEEAGVKLAAARQEMNRAAGGKPEQVAAAGAKVEQALSDYRAAVSQFRTQATQLAKERPGDAARLRLLYDAIWAGRGVVEAETDLARQKLAQESLARLREKIAKEAPPNAGLNPRPADPPAAQLPAPPSEPAVRDGYRQLIALAGAAPLGAEARLELADLLAQRGQHDGALALLGDALGQYPPPEVTERLLVRLMACLLEKGDLAGALALGEALSANPKSPAAGLVRYLTGEAHYRQQNWSKAIEAFSAFRDRDPFRNTPGVTDRALVRLGEAYARAGDWNQSRAAFEQVVGRFGDSSPWCNHARYGMGWALEQQKQYDAALGRYREVADRSGSEIAAKAQVRLGVCLRELKRPAEALKALQLAAWTYDYPAWQAAARTEAGRVQGERR